MFIAESPQRNLFNHAGTVQALGYDLEIYRVRAHVHALEDHGFALGLGVAYYIILVFRKAAVYTCTSCYLFEIFVREFGELFVFIIFCHDSSFFGLQKGVHVRLADFWIFLIYVNKPIFIARELSLNAF